MVPFHKMMLFYIYIYLFIYIPTASYTFFFSLPQKIKVLDSVGIHMSI